MTIRAYYNEIDPYAAQWIRNLIAAGLVCPGDVDERDIRDVRPSDLDGYVRCHFFAGIAVWDYALGLAGWPADRPVWTGSCPCQPFSAAGRGVGFADERHLWPSWFWLIDQCRPDKILGEQVASKDGLGWLDLVQADLEGADYACGAVDLCAAGVGAPHIRQRLWFLADATSERSSAGARQPRLQHGAMQSQRQGLPCLVGNTSIDSAGTRFQPTDPRSRRGFDRRSSFWCDADWIACQDGKARPVEPGTFPLAHGAPARVGRLRAYGNAINAEAAAAFIGACLDAIDDPNPTPKPTPAKAAGPLSEIVET